MALLLKSNEEIELLDLSGILLQLLLDKKSVVDTVNINRLKLEFHVGTWRIPPHPRTIFQTLEDGIDPETSRPGGPTMKLSRAKFLNHPVTYVEGGHYILVKDVIKYAANVAGGKHHDPKPRPEYYIIDALSQRVTGFGMPLGIHQLKSIARVTLRSFQPLVEDVEKRS